jgi:hypothetical protein
MALCKGFWRAGRRKSRPRGRFGAFSCWFAAPGRSRDHEPAARHEAERAKNRTKSKVRAKVEHPFAV